MFKKICTFLTLLSFLGLGSYLPITYYYKLQMIEKHKDYYKAIETNLPEVLFLLENKKLESHNENTFIDNINFYNLTRECMDYYKVESIEEYTHIQREIFRKNSLKNNYMLKKIFTAQKKKFIEAIAKENLGAIR